MKSAWPGLRCSGTAAGFTLLELLVVITIIAIGSAGVMFAMRDGTQASLDREGERLAVLLESARAMSRTTGQPLRWRDVPQGFRFEGLNAANLPGSWLNANTGVIWDAGAAQRALTLGPEPIIEAQGVTLVQDGHLLRVATDGLRPFVVEPSP